MSYCQFHASASTILQENQLEELLKETILTIEIYSK